MIDNKKVSIIIPCFNCELYVQEAILSAVNQTYKNIEIIVVNDGSTDKSRDVILKLLKKYDNISFYDYGKNKGVVYARNFAIGKAKGEIILPLDSDDKIHSEYVERAIRIFNSDPLIRLVYSSAKTFGEDNHIREAVPEDKFSKIIYGGGIFCSSLFYKEDFKKFGGYKESMKNGFEDWDFYFSYVVNNLRVKRILEPMLYYRITKKESRSDLAIKNKNSLLLKFLKKYKNLYFNDDEFIDRVFYVSPAVMQELKSLSKKVKKYRRILNIFTFCLVLYLLIIWRISL